MPRSVITSRTGYWGVAPRSTRLASSYRRDATGEPRGRKNNRKPAPGNKAGRTCARRLRARTNRARVSRSKTRRRPSHCTATHAVDFSSGGEISPVPLAAIRAEMLILPRWSRPAAAAAAAAASLLLRTPGIDRAAGGRAYKDGRESALF